MIDRFFESNEVLQDLATRESIQLGNFILQIFIFLLLLCKDYNDERWANDTKSKKGETSGIRMT